MEKEDFLKELSSKGLQNIQHANIDSGLLNNRYKIGKEIGVGGLSLVHQVTDIYCEYFKDDREIVIKIPSTELAKKKDISAFIYSEYSLLLKLNHGNIVKVLDFGIDDKRELPYIVMERLKGDLLVNISIHKVSKKMKMKLAMSLYNALSYIHKKGIVHADINPTNIMISADGHAKIFDFGISQSIKNKKNFAFSLEKGQAYNPIYSAPEIHEGKAPTKNTDIFSLACVLYELYTHKLPFKENSLELKENPLNKEQLSKIPFMQKAWFKKALQYKPEKRTINIPLCVRLKQFINNKIE
jgi:serine/threonine protein kinase